MGQKREVSDSITFYVWISIIKTFKSLLVQPMYHWVNLAFDFTKFLQVVTVKT